MDILKEIDKAFAEDPSIDEIGLMHGYDVSHTLLTQHKLGISSKSIKKLLKYVSTEIRLIITQSKRSYGHGISNDRIEDRIEKTNVMISLTRAALIVRADNPLALNIRKNLLISGALNYASEIYLLNLIFVLHPKSPSCWEHRRWCLARLHPQGIPWDVLEQELEICAKSADVYARNYYAWLHRIWLLRLATSLHPQIDPLSIEIDSASRWLPAHISDYSAASYHHTCLLLSNPNISTLQVHMNINRDLLCRYPLQENLWLQRRGLMTMCLSCYQDTQGGCTYLPTSSLMNLSSIELLVSPALSLSSTRDDSVSIASNTHLWAIDSILFALSTASLCSDIDNQIHAQQLSHNDSQKMFSLFFKYLAFALIQLLDHKLISAHCSLSNVVRGAASNIFSCLAAIDISRKGLWTYFWNKLAKTS